MHKHGDSGLDADFPGDLHDFVDAVRAQQEDARPRGDELGYICGGEPVDVTELREGEEKGLCIATDGERHLVEGGDDASVGAEYLTQRSEERFQVALDAAVEDLWIKQDEPLQERRLDSNGGEELELGLE
jgi:hypothetical protein